MSKAQTFKRRFLKMEVYDNRLEITEGMIPFRKRQTIPFRNIADVEVSKFTKRLVVRLNDGKERTFAFGGTGRKAQAAHQAIVERL